MKATYLTTFEKKAVAKVLLDIMYADGKVTDNEKDYMEKLKNIFGISDPELEQSQDLGAPGCISILRELPDDEKDTLAELMFGLIKADGIINEDELKVFTTICEGADIALPPELYNQRASMN